MLGEQSSLLGQRELDCEKGRSEGYNRRSINRMRLIIHRGTHEIGGSCVEICSDSGDTRIVIDLGMPLVTPDGSPFEWRRYNNLSPEQLTDKRVLPPIAGLYAHQKPSVAAVLLSHAHQDHFGFLRFVHPGIPLYLSPGTLSLVEVSNIFLGTEVNLDQVLTFDMWEPFQIGDFTITPYLMDHSAPDAAAFLVQADGQKLFYTGDFRGHGRKGMLLERLIADPITDVDCLVMEGSMLGMSEGPYRDEAAVEKALHDIIADQGSYTFIFCSSQNLDRLVSVYRAVKRVGATLVIDLYTAFVLDKLRSISTRIPQFDWDRIRVLYSYSHAQKLAAYDKELLYKYRRTKIGFEEIKANPKDTVLLCKDNSYFRVMLRHLGDLINTKAIYSMWHGYLMRSNLARVLESHGIGMIEIHTSGHAYREALQRLSQALKPKYVVPIHTFHPEYYSELFENVIQLSDGEELHLSGSPRRKGELWRKG